jgi:hypothetical protein
MISKLLGNHEQIIRNLRSDLEICDIKYHDIGTNDFLTDLMEIHEKMIKGSTSGLFIASQMQIADCLHLHEF